MLSQMVPELTERQSMLIDAYIVDLSVANAAARVGCSEPEAMAMLSLEHVANRVDAILDLRSRSVKVDKYYIVQTLIRIIAKAEDEGQYKNCIAGLKLLGDTIGVYNVNHLVTAPPQVLFNMPAPNIDPDYTNINPMH